MVTVKKQLFDLSYLSQLEDKGIIEEVINLYLEETQSDMLKMKMELNKSDYGNIRAIVDKMKVSTGMIQADQFYLLLEEIETIAKYGGEYRKFGQLEKLAQYEFNQLKYELELYLKNIHPIMKHRQEVIDR